MDFWGALSRQQAPPGSDFLEARVRRAAAVPAAERSPEVAGFLEIMSLLPEIHALLPPLEAEQPPSVPPGLEEGGAFALLAFAKAALADYLAADAAFFKAEL